MIWANARGKEVKGNVYYVIWATEKYSAFSWSKPYIEKFEGALYCEIRLWCIFGNRGEGNKLAE